MAREQKLIFIEDKPLLQDVAAVILGTSETKTYNLSDLKSDAKYLRLDTTFTLSDATKSNYRPQVKAKIKVVYSNVDLNDDIFYVVLNRDLEVSATSYKNTSTLQLQGNDISTIDITITNNSSTPIELLSTTLYQSKDLSDRQIVEVFRKPTMVADIVQALSIFSDTIFTQILRTAVMSITTINARPGQTVNYIEIEDWTQSFFTTVLSEETEQFSIKTTVAGREKTIYYWYAAITGENAYKDFTPVDPRTTYPDISDSDRDEYRLMVYKPLSKSKKLSFEFALNENGNWIPAIVYGAGVSSEDGSRLGKGFTYKDEMGFKLIYEKDDGTGTVGIVMDKDGVHIVGWADQHCEYITFKDNGVKFKFVGESEQKFEYVLDENEKISGYIQNALYYTAVGYESGTI